MIDFCLKRNKERNYYLNDYTNHVSHIFALRLIIVRISLLRKIYTIKLKIKLKLKLRNL